MPTTIFRPTSPTNQNRPKMKISNFCVFCPIWIKFGIWANNGPRITWYKFEMATATFYASTETPHIPSRTIILFRFYLSIGFYCRIEFKDNLRTIEPRFPKNLRTNEARSDFTGPYKKKVQLSSFLTVGMGFEYSLCKFRIVS